MPENALSVLRIRECSRFCSLKQLRVCSVAEVILLERLERWKIMSRNFFTQPGAAGALEYFPGERGELDRQGIVLENGDLPVVASFGFAGNDAPQLAYVSPS